MGEPKKIQVDSMYGEFGNRQLIIPRYSGETAAKLQASIIIGCIKQSLEEATKDENK